MTRIEKKQDEIIEFYGKHLSANAVFLELHHAGAKQEDVEKGELLRKELIILKAREEKNPTHYERKFVEWLLNCADSVVFETDTTIEFKWQLGAGKGESLFTTKQIYKYWREEIFKKKK